MVDGPTMTVIDWPSAGRSDPFSDVALTLLGLAGGKRSPGTPLLTRLFEPLGRTLILRGYLRAYRKRSPIDRELLARWRVVPAGHRPTYGIAGEQELLLRVIEARGT